ncbi:hypothetical protein PV411_38320 [Streptomyces sp. NRRL_B-16638]|jgi:hypothetical protein|uniref:Helix-turn-helix domain-containing protein n=2 Tax=Streptomyces coelicolor TaxID=1902 RepID=Q9ACZ3_STRCO|nr:hypothetical protein [Streptomyces sp. NRRL_B-16638]AGO88620.1 hypothetical protein [Streptomyces coelicolor]MDX2930349.1 hypothetical protein [Streptomyces sp. NRRL_B-16638]CAC36679.1 hypothetical protein [Streptomyces coelicolor A3(2)]
MQHVSACRHINPVVRLDVSKTALVADTSRHPFGLICDSHAQEIGTTASRRLRRGADFLAAVQFMVGAGYHPKAGRTTVQLAEIFAKRMARSSEGHFPFSAEATARELGLKRRAVYNHARYLRELGLVAYVEHGSKRNVLRTRYGSAWTREHGYRGTATLFAAVAPRMWDEALGRRIEGEGYTARQVGVTDAGRELAIAAAVDKQRRMRSLRQTEPVDNSGQCTPSVVVPQPRSSSSVGGGIKDRTRERACREKSPRHRAKGSTGWSAARTAAAMREARCVQLHTWWTQGSCVRQLAHSLRPFFEAGWSWEEIARELARWTVPLRPRHVASYVSSEIRRRVNTGQLFLPDGLIAPYRQPTTSTWDDNATRHGPRYAAMQALKARTFRPAAARAAAAFEEIRRILGRRAEPGPATTSSVCRVPGARPENVLLSSTEIASLVETHDPVVACETLWAQVDEAAEHRLDTEDRLGSWEYWPPAGPEPY